MEVKQIIDTDKIDYTDMTYRLTDCWTSGNSCGYNSNESNQMGIDSDRNWIKYEKGKEIW